MTGKGTKSAFSELRRRRVFNTVAIYIVGAWVALQVSDLAFPGLGIPESAIRYVWIGAFALFPLVLLFGWRYDISRGGIRRTLALDEDPDTPQALKPLDLWFIGSLSTVALAVIALMLVRIGQVEPEILQTAPENSIAVMPFEVCEGRAADQGIAYQLSTEVLNRLAERGSMKVISRVTAYNLAGFGWSAPRISGHLGVQHVLTGEVCRDGDALTISAELRDKDDFIVIRKRYEQVVNPFDQIELRVASLVADAVAAKLGDVSPLAPDVPVNRQAYEQLLICKQHLDHGNQAEARGACRRAVDLQPDYPEALFMLAFLEMGLNPDVGRIEELTTATQKAEEALAIAMGQLEQGRPDFNLHFVIARIQRALAIWQESMLWREAVDMAEDEITRRKDLARSRYEDAERHFRTSITLNPSFTEAYRLLALTIERIGVDRRKEALEIMQQGLERDPFNKLYSHHLANRLVGRGRYREAMELLDRFEALPGGKSDLYWTQLEILNNLGRFDDKFAMLIEILQEKPEAFLKWGVISHLYWLANEIIELGMHDEAEKLFLLLESIPAPEHPFFRQVFLVEKYLIATGRREEAAALYVEKYGGMSNQEILHDQENVDGIANAFWNAGYRERAIELAEGLRHGRIGTFWAERDMVIANWLAEMYIEVGRPEDAVPLLEQVVEYLEREVSSGIRHPQTLGELTTAYARLGEHDAALDLLEMTVDYGGWWVYAPDDPYQVGSTQWWHGLEDNPGFIAQTDRIRAIKDQQVSNIRALLGRNDMEELLQPLITLWEEKSAELAVAQ